MIVSFILSLGLAILILLQSAKTAAVMRSLGMSKTQIRLTSIGEYMLLCLIGSIIGIIMMPILGINLASQVLISAGWFVVGSVIGSSTGAVIISNRSPLSLLQVRE